ncbi:hypothetical protein K503DRAFT_806950 [Rhizopogon vinicolor AM-OR11-026]|uniref:Uncharacterized protein n=1 Tax=Rhizopogon vinicolor AM-OR11-026 TaxID=1314800 RepID=A0A1B7MDG6_9AGAM|nr:hypothetical protein K503DRAFT_806950 [Rhizopogon vinicolor AM-OR11-026]
MFKLDFNKESEGPLPEEKDAEDQSTLNELPEVTPLQASGASTPILLTSAT